MNTVCRPAALKTARNIVVSNLFTELTNEQYGMSLCRLHVAAQTRESALLLRSLKTRARVGTSLCQIEVAL